MTIATCPICQEPLLDQLDYCPSCGATVHRPAPASQSPATRMMAAMALARAQSSDDTDRQTISIAPAAPSPAVTTPLPTPVTTLLPTPVPSVAAVSIPSPVQGHTARLTVKRGGVLSNDAFTFGGTAPIVIGRFDPETGPVDIDLGPLPEGSYVSRQHALLQCSAHGQWSVRDLNSRNGVFVKKRGQPQFGRVAGEQQVHSGDEIALGNARFEFTV